jgi:cell division protein FtsX
MNPLRWKREHLVAGILFCVVGAMIGMLVAWFQSPFYQLCHTSISGEWANCTRVFLEWSPHWPLYWPMVLFGVLIPGMTFYAVQLLRNSN